MDSHVELGRLRVKRQKNTSGTGKGQLNQVSVVLLGSF